MLSKPNINIPKKMSMSDNWENRPEMGFTLIYGKENGGTTTLSLSIVETETLKINNDKNVYVLLTEPAHNFTGPIKKHFPEYSKRFIMPVDENNDITPITSHSELTSWIKTISNKNDVGAVIIDAIDTIRNMLYLHYLFLSPERGAMNYTFVDNDLMGLFLKLQGLHIPVVMIMKQKDETEWVFDGPRIKEIVKTGKIVPSVNTEKILRWSTTRIWCIKIGEYQIVKTKSSYSTEKINVFGFDGSTSKRTGIWLPELFNQMR
jgi:hypothetical protein